MSVEYVSPGNLTERLAVLSLRPHPLLDEVVAAREGGFPVPRFAGKTIHSCYDPREEARRSVDAFCQRVGVSRGDSVATLGNGFGYFAEALLDRGLRPVVFEPVPAFFQGMADHRDAAAFLGKVRYFLVDDPADLYRQGAHKELLEGVKGILPLPYISWLFPSFEDEFRKKREAILSAAGARYKVSVVSPVFGGAVETARYAARGLRESGMSVDLVDTSGLGSVLPSLREFHGKKDLASGDTGLGSFLKWASEQVVARILRFDPAIVIVLPEAPLHPEQIRRMRAEGRRVVSWFVEDYHLFRHWETGAAEFDLLCPIQKGDFPRELEIAGQKRSHYLPLAADESVFFPDRLSAADLTKFGSPASFMGAAYYNRTRFFNVLLDRPFKIWGVDWPTKEPLFQHVQEGGRRVTAEETALIFNGTEVNINLHSSTSHEGVNPFGDFVNPRTFEIAACEAFQLVDSRSLLPDLFLPGREVECFTGRADFLRLFDAYLANPDARREMAGRARERVLREHTYPHRMRELLEAVHEHCPPEAGRRIRTVAEIMEEGSGEEWRELFGGLPADATLDFDGLHRHIFQGKASTHPLSREESLVLILGELRHGGR